jgi:hypothetical protein
LTASGKLICLDQDQEVKMISYERDHAEGARSLIEAETAGADDIASLAQLISIAHAAFAVADAGIDGSFEPWYRDMGRRLLRRSMDALAVIEADRELRPAVGLN